MRGLFRPSRLRDYSACSGFYVALCALILGLGLPSYVAGSYLTGDGELGAEGANFSWEGARSKSLKILVQYRDHEGNWKQSNLGSGFIISPDGLFVTAYHVMKYCLEKERASARFAAGVDCSVEHPVLHYRARNGSQEFEFEIVSYLKEQDSINGKERQSPDDTIKHRDFVIGRLKTGSSARFPYWEVRDFKRGTINLSDPRADFEFEPLLPPRKVFIAGYPENREFTIAHGFLNLMEARGRGYFAADLAVYSPGYLLKHGIAQDTKWGIQVENHMSGGAVIDPAGFLVGLVVSGNSSTAGVLSIENVLETFFSASNRAGSREDIILSDSKVPLFLKKGAAD